MGLINWNPIFRSHKLLIVESSLRKQGLVCLSKYQISLRFCLDNKQSAWGEDAFLPTEQFLLEVAE